MGIKFFGHYLLDEGVLTKEQLMEAIEYQSSQNLSLGQIAVRESLISEQDADKINTKQRILDKRFGEVAISLGLLSDQQISMLLQIQKKEKVFFGEVLIAKNFINKENLSKELEKFEQEQHLEVVKLDSKIEAIDTEGTITYSIAILQKLYSRIVHDYIKLVKVDATADSAREGVIALQKMRGDIHLDFAIQTQDSVSLIISEKFMKMECAEVDEMVLDILAEFVNVVLGNIAVKLSSENKKVDLTPPTIVKDADFAIDDYHIFDFITTQGSLTLYLKL